MREAILSTISELVNRAKLRHALPTVFECFECSMTNGLFYVSLITKMGIAFHSKGGLAANWS
ncbi:hypothetical protein PISMIDRAFT_549235 [Pisolithus microcarpus 441]|uniref:Unplaced genomic scaffold scaffold_69, whole genome shotgun sequence n=1 Tax=Pisolithus microcarpus 441 TaxID=765257 RepID=A0A0C9YX18_9AGAM|nr:hypothetical protein PISMIDRAFT_549235 [Pisolithus microcarpus 441]